MGLISKMYEKDFLKRYDKDEAIPYYCPEDFPGLLCEPGSFVNSAGASIRYFKYCYPGYDAGKLILFCPGMGPGHTAYLAEIETICRAGLRVLTLDYTGCGSSGGERMDSVNAHTRDVVELTELLRPEEELIPVGHSLGGYTALNIAHLNDSVKRAVIISGFVSIADEMMGFVKLRLLANRISRFEKKLDPCYGALDDLDYLASTQDKILWFHSTDDPMVNYKYNAGKVSKLDNPNLRVVTVEGRKEYFSDKPIGRMTEQDPAV